MTERESTRGHHHHHHDKGEDGKGSSRHHSSRKEKELHEPKERRGSAAPPPGPTALLAPEAKAGDRASIGPAGARKSMAPTKASVLASDKDHGKAVLAAQSKHEETFLEREVKTDKHRALVMFPEGDIQVVEEQRSIRTMSKEVLATVRLCSCSSLHRRRKTYTV